MSRIVPALCLTLAVVLPAAAGAQEQSDVQRGREAIEKHGCAVCHQVPGIHSPGGGIGPPLTGIAKRGYIAGVLANEPANLQRWIMHPQSVKAATAMPDTGVTAQEAADIAAYLYAKG